MLSSLVGSFAEKDSTWVDFDFHVAPFFQRHLHIQMAGKQEVKLVDEWFPPTLWVGMETGTDFNSMNWAKNA